MASTLTTGSTMPEPTTTAAAATLAAATGTVPVLIAFGVPLGLRPDVLIAGFAGSISAMALLGSVPATGDTWRNLVHTSVRRMMVAFASSATAGYMTPMLLAGATSEAVLLGSAFAIGSCAQHVLAHYLKNIRNRRLPPPGGPAADTGRGEL